MICPICNKDLDKRTAASGEEYWICLTEVQFFPEYPESVHYHYYYSNSLESACFPPFIVSNLLNSKCEISRANYIEWNGSKYTMHSVLLLECKFHIEIKPNLQHRLQTMVTFS